MAVEYFQWAFLLLLISTTNVNTKPASGEENVAEATIEEAEFEGEDDGPLPYPPPGLMPPFPGGPEDSPPGLMPPFPGGPAWGPNSPQFKMMQTRLAALKKKFDSLNETEREEIKEKAKAFRQKMEEDAKAMQEKMEEDLKNGKLPPPPPFMPPPMCPPCNCEEEDDEDEFEDDEELPEPQRFPPYQFPHRGPYFPQRPPWMRPPTFYKRPMGPQMGPPQHPMGPQQHPMGPPPPGQYGPKSRARRDADWWYDIDSGVPNEVSDSLHGWNAGYAAFQKISDSMDRYSIPHHVGTINRGTIKHPEMGGPGDRIFGADSDFNPYDYHAFKFKPRGEYYPVNLEDWKTWLADGNGDFNLPAGGQFYYHPRTGQQGITAQGGQIWGGQFLDTDKLTSLAPGRYALERMETILGPTVNNVPGDPIGVNAILKNTLTGQFFRVDSADMSKLQAATPYKADTTADSNQMWLGGVSNTGSWINNYMNPLYSYPVPNSPAFYSNYHPYYYV